MGNLNYMLEIKDEGSDAILIYEQEGYVPMKITLSNCAGCNITTLEKSVRSKEVLEITVRKCGSERTFTLNRKAIFIPPESNDLW